MNLVGAHAAARLKPSAVYVEPCLSVFACILKIKFCLLFYCRAYDRAAIKFRGVDADINFNLSDYEEDLKQVTTR